MAIFFESKNPESLLKDFKKKIDDGLIHSWSYDQDGDFTHTPEQWKNRAWLRPKVDNGFLNFYILNPKGQSISSLVYAVYHGRFLESMLLHCDSFFYIAKTTSFPDKNDRIT